MDKYNVKVFKVFEVFGTFIPPVPAGKRAPVVDLEKTRVAAPSRMAASASMARFLNDSGKFNEVTEGERFSPTFAINCLHIEVVR